MIALEIGADGVGCLVLLDRNPSNGVHKQLLRLLIFADAPRRVLVGALLLPRASDISDIQAMQQTFAAQAGLLQACALLEVFGYWAALVGTIGLSRSITAQSAERTAGAAWARLGLYFALVATVLWTIGFAIDVAYAAALVNWQAATPAGKDAAYGIVVVLSPLGFGRGLFLLMVLANGLAFSFLGLGMARSILYPRWLSWVATLLGAAGVALGITQTFTGRERSLTLFVVLEAVTILWFAVVGVVMARHAWAPGQGSSRGPDEKDLAPN
jgi:hypothetical protein